MRDIDHWLIEDDDQQHDHLLFKDNEEVFRNEFNPEEFETYNDKHSYEILIP